MSKEIANELIEVCIDIAKDSYSNNATTYLDFYNLENLHEEFYEELMEYILEDDRVITCEMFALNDNDISIVFTEEALQ